MYINVKNCVEEKNAGRTRISTKILFLISILQDGIELVTPSFSNIVGVVAISFRINKLKISDKNEVYAFIALIQLIQLLYLDLFTFFITYCYASNRNNIFK